MDSWVVEALRVGYRIPFDRPPPLSERPLSLPAYSPHSIRGVALNQELQDLLRKGAVEPAPQSPGFYSRLFLVKKASGSWRPIIDLSTLNDYITSSRFHMETPRSVLNSIRPGDWMISLDLQDAYLQVPVHHDSRRFFASCWTEAPSSSGSSASVLRPHLKSSRGLWHQCPPSSTGMGSGYFVTWTIGSSWPLQRSPVFSRGTGSCQSVLNLASRSTSRSHLWFPLSP